MPKMTGIELSKYVKEARPELKFVIMSSMSVRKQEWRHIVPFTKYMNDFVGRPFSIEEIADMIRKFAQEQTERNDI